MIELDEKGLKNDFEYIFLGKSEYHKILTKSFGFAFLKIVMEGGQYKHSQNFQ